MITETHRQMIDELVQKLTSGEIPKTEFDREFSKLIQMFVKETKPDYESEVLAKSDMLSEQETSAEQRIRNAATIARKL